MELLHVSHRTPLTLEEAVAAAINNPSVEVDLAASKYFWNFDGDLNAVAATYDSFFESSVASLNATLGDPIYRRTPGVDRDEWMKVLPKSDDSQDFAVWIKDGTKLYLRYSWEDKEIPILIALGVEGCKETGATYPGQFGDEREEETDARAYAENTLAKINEMIKRLS